MVIILLKEAIFYGKNQIITGLLSEYDIKTAEDIQEALKEFYVGLSKIATKKWAYSIRDWGKVYGELSIMYTDRIPE